MKRKHILLALCAVASTLFASAQPVNRIYQYVGELNTGLSTAVIHRSDSSLAEEVFFVSVERDTNGSFIDRAVITKVNATTGNFMGAIRRDTSQGMERLIPTADRNLILLSMFVDKMVVTKYDRSLNQIWAVQIPHTAAWVHRGYHYMDIEKVYYPNPRYNPNLPPDHPDSKPTIEEYCLVYPVSSDIGDLTNEVATKMVRLDNRGMVRWARTYDKTTRTISSRRDFACALTSFKIGNNIFYPVIGGRNTGLSSSRLYGFVVDDNGDMVTDFTRIETADFNPFRPDIIYDPNTDSLIISYTEENGGINPNTTYNVSGFGVLKMDKYFAGGYGRYYWHDCENYANSVSLLANGDYMIGGTAGQCTPGMGFLPNTAAFLRLKPNLNPMLFTRYNVASSTGFLSESVHCTDAQNYSYILANNTSLTNTLPPRGLSNDIRLIKADIAGTACGAKRLDIQYIDFEINIDLEEYDVYDWQPSSPIGISASSTQPNMIPCSENAAGKPTSVDAIIPASLRAEVYPTIIQNRSLDKITCHVSSPENRKIDIIISNQLGQVIYNQQHTVSTGNNTITVPAHVLSSGINILRITGNNQILNTTKIAVAD